MTVDRVPEMLDFYGPDTMFLIGGDLLKARAALAEATRAFTRRVAEHGHG
jgi:ribulose-bisphosphate carboxylase large chain